MGKVETKGGVGRKEGNHFVAVIDGKNLDSSAKVRNLGLGGKREGKKRSI